MKIRYKNTHMECETGLIVRDMTSEEVGRICFIDDELVNFYAEPLGCLRQQHVNQLEVVIPPGTYISRSGTLGIMLKGGIASAEVLTHNGGGITVEEWPNTSFELADEGQFPSIPECHITTMLDALTCERNLER